MRLKTVDDLCFLFFNYSQLNSPSYMVYVVFLECEIIQLPPIIVKQNNRSQAVLPLIFAPHPCL